MSRRGHDYLGIAKLLIQKHHVSSDEAAARAIANTFVNLIAIERHRILRMITAKARRCEHEPDDAGFALRELAAAVRKTGRK